MTALPARTLVLAIDQPTARQWCRDNGIEPYSRWTYILGPHTGRGFNIEPQDRVVFVGAIEDRDDIADVLLAFAPTLMGVGGFAKIEFDPPRGESARDLALRLVGRPQS